MTDLNKPTEAETTNTTTAQTDAPETAQSTCDSMKGRCGWSREQWMAHRGKRRWKVIGGAVLIFFLGLMAGKASNHHHGMYHGAMMGGQATVMIPGEKPKPLSAILDSIQATPEQRAKAADLVY